MNDWFGELPKNWKVVRLCDHAKVVNGYPFDSDMFHTTDGMPLVRIRDISEETTEVRFAGEPVAEATIHRGDILVGMDGDFNVARWRGEDALLNQRVCCIRPKNTLNASLIRYLLALPLKILNDLTYSTTVKHLSSLDVLKVRFPLPSSDEQRLIADFLDRETARLDALVTAKERWLELLAEKRRALITRAVTRGLNRNPQMVNTGTEWLPEVPRSWRPTKIGRLFAQTKRLGFADLTVLSVYREYGVIQRSTRDDNHNRIPDDLEKYQLVQPGDLVINKMKAWQGSLGVSEFKGITSPDYVVFSPIHREESKYLHFLLRNQLLTTVYLSMSNGIRTNQWRIEPDRFASLRLFLPPLDEQRAIVAHISSETAKIDTLRSATERTIGLLRERRAALIAAAVTGKIAVPSPNSSAKSKEAHEN